MTDEQQAKIDALKTKGEESAKEAVAEREQGKNWNKGLEEGSMLAGIMEYGDKIYKEGWESPRYIMAIRDHETAELYTVWCSAYMLNEAVIQKAPAKGSLVVVQYHGKEQLQNGRSMHVFSVETESTDFEYWENLDRAFNKKQAQKAAAPAAASRPKFGPDEAPF
ncbi:MAG: hypothetical protein ABFR89_02380 [Actinomycetota bacterium]